MTDMEFAYRMAKINKAWEIAKCDPCKFNHYYARFLEITLIGDLMENPGLRYEHARKLVYQR